MTNDKSPRTPEGGQALKNDNTHQFDNKGLFETKGMRVARAGEMGELGNGRIRKCENEKMRVYLEFLERLRKK